MDDFKQIIDKEIIKKEILINLQKYELTNENLVYLLQIVKNTNTLVTFYSIEKLQ